MEAYLETNDLFFISSVHIKAKRKHRYVIDQASQTRGQAILTGHTQQLFTHLSQGQESPVESGVNVCGLWKENPHRHRQNLLKSTEKGLESNPTPSCEEASVAHHHAATAASVCTVSKQFSMCANRKLEQIYLTREYLC